MAEKRKLKINTAGRLNAAVAANVARSGQVTRSSRTQNVEIIQRKGRTTIVDHGDKS